MKTTRKTAALAAALIALGMLGSQAMAGNLNGTIGGPIKTTNFEGAISGSISYPVSDLAHGFNANACSGLQVAAEVPARVQPKLGPGIHLGNTTKMTTVGESKHLKASLDGTSVECAYSIADLGAATYTVAPEGVPHHAAIGQLTPYFNPDTTTIKLHRSGIFVTSKSNVDFAFSPYLYGK
jgi:hypothetical protein